MTSRRLTIFVTGVLIAGGVYAFIDHNATAVRRRTAAMHLRYIIFELYIYEDIYGRIPHAIERNDAGEPMHSWRLAACRTLFGSTGFYGQQLEFGEPWDSPKNKRYFDGPHHDYGGSPTSFIERTRPGDFTRFVAITGPDTAFDGQNDVKLSNMPDDLIIIVETRHSMQHWMKPGGDFDVRSMPREIAPPRRRRHLGPRPRGFSRRLRGRSSVDARKRGAVRCALAVHDDFGSEDRIERGYAG